MGHLLPPQCSSQGFKTPAAAAAAVVPQISGVGFWGPTHTPEPYPKLWVHGYFSREVIYTSNRFAKSSINRK